MLIVAEDFEKKSGRKPRIAFNVGAAHSGIEDFLVAGHEFTSWLIAQYPKPILWRIIEENGGIDNFCSARILTLPDGIKAEELGDASQREEVGRYLDKTVVSEKIVDDKLREMLRNQFVEEEQAARRQSMEELRGVFKKHLSEGANKQMEDLITSLLALDPENFDKLVRVTRNEVGESRNTDFELLLPYDVASLSRPDIQVSIATKDGKLFSEKIVCSIDEEGRFTQRGGKTIIPKEKLIPTIGRIFPNAPKDAKVWSISGGLAKYIESRDGDNEYGYGIGTNRVVVMSKRYQK